jgi:glycosyltransferase involved in cell wall biosynthesis
LIVILADDIRPRLGGGVATHIWNKVRTLREERFALLTWSHITANVEKKCPRCAYLNVRVAPGEETGPRFILRLREKFLEFIATLDPSPLATIVNCHSQSLALIGASIAKRLKARSLFSFHFAEGAKDLPDMANLRLEQFAWRSYDALVANSHHTLETLRRCHGEPTAPTSVILPGCRQFAPFRCESRLFSAAFVGRLSRLKGIDYFLDIIAASNSDDERFLIIGENARGEELDWKDKIIRDLRLAKTGSNTYTSRKVEFRSYLSQERLFTLLRRCACLVVPSRYEPFGRIAQEAASIGVPVFFNSAGGLMEALAGASGAYPFSIESLRPESLLRSIRKLGAARPLNRETRSDKDEMLEYRSCYRSLRGGH